MQNAPLFLFSFLLLSFFPTETSAQSPIRKGTDYALFFVVDNFDHWHGFPKKSTQQIRDIESELKEAYGFKTDFLYNPDKDGITAKLKTYQERSYNSDDQFLIYFSMHGHLEGATGSLVPKNGTPQDPFCETWIPHALLADWIDRIPCKHIMVAIDACYSGTFGGQKGKPLKPAFASTDDCASKVSQALTHQSRLYATSGGAERTPTDSEFAKKWLEALRVRNTDGVLFNYELIGTLNEASPKPRYGDFQNHAPGGDFVFVHQQNCHVSSPLQDATHWEQLKGNPTQDALLEHIRMFPQCLHEDDIPNLLVKFSDVPDQDKPSPTPPDNFVFIKGGSFQMGSDNKDAEDDEKPVHQVKLDDFYIGRFEVTFEEYDVFCEATGKELPEDQGWGRKNRPVIKVSWFDAVDYCNWLSQQHQLQKVYTINGRNVIANWNANGYRLPSEAEWEYAARSRGKDHKWAGTSAESELAVFANYYEDGKKGKDGYTYTAPVGSFDANDVGLYDMSGNVSEWCWDRYGEAYYTNSKNAQNPKGSDTGLHRVLRGGSWNLNPAYLRCTFRSSSSPDYRNNVIGFRLSRAGR